MSDDPSDPSSDQPPSSDEPDSPRHGIGARDVKFLLDDELDDPPDAARLAGMLSRVVGELGAERCELRVVVVGDQRMTELHERFAGVRRTTDVLTFDMGAGAGDGGVDGEIYVCWCEARRAAAGFAHSAEDELLLYAVHGLLHLMGHDDGDETSHRIMHEREDELLSAIGLGATYHGETLVSDSGAGEG